MEKQKMHENLKKVKKQNSISIIQTLTSKRGITLLALVITVIVLLILAGVALSAIIGEDGIFSKAENSIKKWENAMGLEANLIQDYEGSIDAIEKLQHTVLEFNYIPSNWTNGNVEVGILNKLENEGYKLEYSLNNGMTWNPYVNKLTITENGTNILARLVKMGIAGETTTGNVSNIDIVKPQSFNLSSSDITESGFKISASTEDGEPTNISGKSGIKEYKYYIKRSTDTEYQSETVNVDTSSKTYTGLSQNTIYNVYVEAYDNAGNKTSTEVVNVATLKRLVLYEMNNEYKEITGGWNNYLSSRNYTYRKDPTCLTLYASTVRDYWSCLVVKTANKINFTGYDKLNITLQLPILQEGGGGVGAGVGITNGSYDNHGGGSGLYTPIYLSQYSRNFSAPLGANDVTLEWNITDYNESNYIAFNVYAGGRNEIASLYIKKVWLD